MSRKAVKITEEKFIKTLRKKASKTEFFQEEYYTEEIEEMSAERLIYNVMIGQEMTKLFKDIGKIDVSFENVLLENNHRNYPLGFKELPNGVNGYLIMVGGDWEYPVAVFMYYDGKDFRAYVPKDGNSYNKKYKCAYGSEPNKIDREAFKPEEHDFEKMFKDIENRIQVA